MVLTLFCLNLYSTIYEGIMVSTKKVNQKTYSRPELKYLSAEEIALLEKVKKICENGPIKSSDLVHKLLNTGLLQLYLPKKLQGKDANLMATLLILETIAFYDASCAWNVMTGIQSPIFLSYLPKEKFENLYTENPDLFLTNSSANSGEAIRTKDGFKVTGTWRFGSGGPFADYYMGWAKLKDQKKIISVLLSPEDIETIDATWDVIGLKSTNSHTFKSSDVFVPFDNTTIAHQNIPHYDEPQFVLPTKIHFNMHMAAICIGITKAAINEIVGILKNKVFEESNKRKYEQEALLSRIGFFESKIQILKASLLDVAENSWTNASSIRTDQSLHVRLQGVPTCVVRESREIVNELFQYGGSQSIRQNYKLNDCFCDINTLAQHGNLSISIYSNIGKSFVE